VANLCDFLSNTFLLADDMRRLTQRLGLDWTVVNGTPAAVSWVVVDFIYATLIVWVYAAILPRLGAGRQTAVVAALIPYLSATVVLFGFHQMGIFTQDTFLKGALTALVTAVLASLAGAAVYRD
jgi:Kef-type K+ transport system membrane component KefB